jgi:hypothetical protein
MAVDLVTDPIEEIVCGWSTELSRSDGRTNVVIGTNKCVALSLTGSFFIETALV